MFFPNQIEAAEKIITSPKYYILLQAQMQSGKTGTALYAALKLIFTKKKKNIVIVCGASDKSLKEQWNKNVVDLCDCFAKDHLPTMIDVSQIDIEDRVAFVKQNVHVVFNQDLKKNNDLLIKPDSFIIWDESHYGSSENQKIHKTFVDVNLFDSVQGQTEFIEQMNIHILSVTATRSAELTRYNTEDNQNWDFVYLSPGTNYFGPNEFNELELIKQSKPVSDVDFWIDELKSFKDARKYILIRFYSNKEDYKGKTSSDYVKEIARKCGFRFDECNAQSELEIRDLETRPLETTIIHIKGFLRMGKEMKRENVCAVIETSSKNHDTLAQGLLGRVSGYYSSIPDIVCYIPPHSYKTNFLKEYEQYTEKPGRFNMTHTKHVKGKIERASVRNDPFTGTKIIHLKPADCRNADEYTPGIEIDSDNKDIRFHASVITGKQKIREMERSGKLTQYEASEMLKILEKPNLESISHLSDSHKERDGQMVKTYNTKRDGGLSFEQHIIDNTDYYYRPDSKKGTLLRIERATYSFPLNFIKKGDVTLAFRIPKNDEDDAETEIKITLSDGRDIFNTKNVPRTISQECQYSKDSFVKQMERIIRESQGKISQTHQKHRDVIGGPNNSVLRFDTSVYQDLNELSLITVELELRFKLKIKMEKSRGKNGNGWFKLKTLTIIY